MLDYFAILTKGGALLWTLQFTALKHNPVEAINALIRTCLLEERSAESTYTYTPKIGAAQALKWTFHNGLGLVFVAVYQKTLSLLYVEELLHMVKQEFTPSYKPNVYEYKHFDDAFKHLLKQCEARADQAKRGAAVKPAAPPAQKASRQTGSTGGKASQRSSSDDTDGEPAPVKAAQVSSSNGNGVAPAAGGTSADGDSDDSGEQEANNQSDDNKAFDMSRLSGKSGRSRMGGRSGRGGRPPAFGGGKDKAQEKEEVKGKDEAGPRKKAARKWGYSSSENLDKLDFSAAPAEGAADDDDDEVFTSHQASRMDEEDDVIPEEEDEEEVDEEELRRQALGQTGAAEPKKRGVLSSFMSNIAMSVVGKQALSRDDILPALEDMRRKLMERNVAEEISGQICESVARSLEGQKLTSFTGVSTFVRQAFENSLSGILNKRQVDVLMDIRQQRRKGRPYVIVFCGVNGVGKSTNLAKITYWLGQHGIKAMIAACDTFRAGAVEQLKTHCARLKVPLYERGYEKDPAKVAFEAVKQAEREGLDVVLVDTAGRMQDNEPLMRALSNLINVNNPNLVLFVGEALVGNDAVDQLVKFNRALFDLAPAGSTTRHTIDGIVLTKFDTIDDKVGAALSMTYTSGAPIMFVGCGQTYVDLRKLNVRSVVRALLK